MTLRNWAALASGLAGLGLVWWGANWQTSLGVFIVLWAHQIEKIHK